EAGRGRVGKGGVVRDPAVWGEALAGVVAAGGAAGLGLAGAAASTLPGPSGNVEFFVHLRVGAAQPVGAVVAGAVEAGLAVTGRSLPQERDEDR
ncbi:MAG TPA: hypothetical protein VM324_08765, partial [Egibacteraceae bacterium]|nr:hypothetical protein [Egibacteraceae bacterium]